MGLVVSDGRRNRGGLNLGTSSEGFGSKFGKGEEERAVCIGSFLNHTLEV